MYSACLGPECTFQPDTTVSRYYYQRLETRDPAYQQRAGSAQASPSAQQQQNNNQRLNRHYRNLSEGLSEKERLHRSLKKSATLSNDLFDPDSGMPFSFHPRVGRGPRNQVRPDPLR